MDPKKLPDQQLYALVKNAQAGTNLKYMAEEEFNRRNFSVEYIDRLDIEYQQSLKLRTTDAELSLAWKIGIILFPFFTTLQAILANRHIQKGETKKWKQTWQCIAIGHGLWAVLISLLVRLFFPGGFHSM